MREGCKIPEIYKIPGFQESIICLSNIALHGLVFNELLLWVDIQRRTVTAKEWKEKAEKHFTEEEISDAKNILWDICDEKTIGKIIKRQGPSKKQSEITDIENALNSLAFKGEVPLFIASSSMVMRTPVLEQVQPGLKDIEQMVDA